jgi:uncharacterized protein YdhG (YjbR/CyaY superfamily)
MFEIVRNHGKRMTPDEYYQLVSPDRFGVMQELRKTINENLPHGFEETVSYGMPGWVVPKSLYPPGYHCNPSLALHFINIASQKQHIAIYHMGLYGSEELMEWFLTEWKKQQQRKPDMGKSCIRFKKPEHIPVELIGHLCRKMSPVEWIACYEKGLKR